MLFTAVRNGAAPKDPAELVGRIRDVARRNDELRAAEQTRGNGGESQRVDEPKPAALQREGADVTAKEVPSQKRPAHQAPQQRTLALPEQVTREQKLDADRKSLGVRVEKLLAGAHSFRADALLEKLTLLEGDVKMRLVGEAPDEPEFEEGESSSREVFDADVGF